MNVVSFCINTCAELINNFAFPLQWFFSLQMIVNFQNHVLEGAARVRHVNPRYILCIFELHPLF